MKARRIIVSLFVFILLITGYNLAPHAEAYYYNNIHPQLNQVIDINHDGTSYSHQFELKRLQRNEYLLNIQDISTEPIEEFKVTVETEGLINGSYDIFVNDMSVNSEKDEHYIYLETFYTPTAEIVIPNISKTGDYQIIVRTVNEGMTGTIKINANE